MAGQVKMHLHLDFIVDRDQNRMARARRTFILFT